MALSFRESAPPVSDIVCGSTFSNGGTIITVPAGRIWSGNVELNAVAEGGAVSGAPTITIQGTGSVPAPGTIIAHLYVRSALLGAPMCPVVAKNVVIAATSGAVTLQLNLAGASAATGLATGQLL